MQEFPILSKLDPAVYGPPESALTKELIEQELNGLSVEKVSISACIMIYGFISSLALYMGFADTFVSNKISCYLKKKKSSLA